MPTVRLGKPSGKPQQGAQSSLKSTDAGLTSIQVIDKTDTQEIILQALDAGNNPVHLGESITFTVATANAAVVDVLKHRADAFKYTPTGPGGPTNITVVLTYRSGSPGPYTITIPMTVVGAKGNELQALPGTLTIS